MFNIYLALSFISSRINQSDICFRYKYIQEYKRKTSLMYFLQLIFSTTGTILYREFSHAQDLRIWLYYV